MNRRGVKVSVGVYSRTMQEKGHIHPLTHASRETEAIFRDMGFEVAYGKELIPEVENFDLLNFEPDHPARDTHDTFWIKGTRWSERSMVPRTHISSLQVPFLKEHTPPVRMISTGVVYRAEATDATHDFQFHYTEGLAVERGATLEHLKGTLDNFLKKFLRQESIQTRFRPGNFPFVEPGVEIDMWYEGRGAGSARGGRWMEILGAGMVHPAVLRNAGIDPDEYSGYAFGIGMTRLLKLRHDIDDIRNFYSGDLRFVNQFPAQK